MERTDYLHRVQYYETDKMGITHHSNYIRWMEEARVDFLQKIGWPYEKLEQMGIYSPVTAVNCKFRAPTRFPDTVRIRVSVAECSGLRLRIHYEMRREDRLVLEGDSEHCFLDADGRLLRLQRESPELCKLLTELAEETQRGEA